jgi:hypothetical protein
LRRSTGPSGDRSDIETAIGQYPALCNKQSLGPHAKKIGVGHVEQLRILGLLGANTGEKLALLQIMKDLPLLGGPDPALNPGHGNPPDAAFDPVDTVQ